MLTAEMIKWGQNSECNLMWVTVWNMALQIEGTERHKFLRKEY